jgi:hypothetical protein
MLLPAGFSYYGFRYDNWGANPGGSIGTSVVPGASNVEGSWTQIASSANIAQDCYWIYLLIHSGATSTAQKDHLVDIGVDPAGGTSYTAIISNIDCGASPSLTSSGSRQFSFPFFIKAGSSVAVRVQGSNATAGTVRVAAQFFGQPSAPENVPIGAISQTFGTISGSAGPTVTPGNAADGSWVDLGATSTALWWWQMGYGISNGTVTIEYTYFEVAFGNVTNKHTIFKCMHVGNTTENVGLAIAPQASMPAAFCPVPAGQNIYVRARCSDAPDTGYHANVIGIGG